MMPRVHACAECGAVFSSEHDCCAARFDQLLALDHSRREPWGSRHGQAFAVFVLQHRRRFPSSVNSAWAALYRIYCLGQPARQVFDAMRADATRAVAQPDVPPIPSAPAAFPDITIADLGEFAATDYPSQLDAWCRATLRAWGATSDLNPLDE
jgi:hypothetical protein